MSFANGIGAGVAVPRRSPRSASFSGVTNRSGRLSVSPSESATFITHDGPPRLTSSRFLAVLRYLSPQATLGGSLSGWLWDRRFAGEGGP